MATQLIRRGKKFRPLARAPRRITCRAQRIWQQGAHNAFTDLCLYQGRYYCVFREATAHVSPDGALRILQSSDGKRWRSVALRRVDGNAAMTKPLGWVALGKVLGGNNPQLSSY